MRPDGLPRHVQVLPDLIECHGGAKQPQDLQLTSGEVDRNRLEGRGCRARPSDPAGPTHEVVQALLCTARIADLGKELLGPCEVLSETQVRYEHSGVVVARLTVTGPVHSFMTAAGQGHWELKAQIGSGTQDVHLIELPETDEIVYG